MSTSSQSNDQPIAQPTPEHEQEIRAREAAATEGPWGRDAARGPYFRADSPAGEFGTLVGDVHFGCGAQAAADREFTAHAREDVRGLLALVDRLRAEQANWRCPGCDTWNGATDKACICCDTLRGRGAGPEKVAARAERGAEDEVRRMAETRARTVEVSG